MRVLEQVKKVSPNLFLEQEQVEEIIKNGDAIWEQCKNMKKLIVKNS